MSVVKTLMVRGGADFSKLDKALGRTSKNARNMQTSFGRATKGMQASVTKLNGVLSKALAIAGVASFAALSKQAISTASDLREVQNVVDTAFGKMSASAEKFAQKAKLFNMSELQAKNTSSIYMAMSKSMGIAEEQASRMSIATAALSGDMSSFFNVSQEVSSTALKGIFTGESEPLKRFGIVMTEATLSTYAMEKGLNKNYRAMTDAEKVTLRYSYVMEKLAYVQGDAEKTAGSWANKTRRIGETFKSTLGDFGAGLINILNGPLDVVERLLGKLEYAAKLFRAITEQVFGKSDGSSGSAQVAAATGEAAANASDLEDNLTAAGEAAKRATLPIDQLHQLSGGDDGKSDKSAALDMGQLTGVDDYYQERLAADDLMDSDMTAEIEARAKEIVEKLKWLREKVGEFKNAAFEKIGSKVSFEDIKEKVTDIIGWLDDHKNTIISIVAGVAAGIGVANIVGKVSNVAKAVSVLGGPLKIGATLMKGFASSIGLVSGPLIAIAAIIGIVVAALWQLYNTNEEVRLHMDAALEGLKDLWSDVCTLFQSLWQSVLKPVLDQLWQLIQKIWNDVILPIMEKVAVGLPYFIAIIDGAIETAIRIIEAIGPSVEKVFGGIVTVIGGVIDLISGLLTGDWGKVMDAFKSIGQGAVDFITGIFEGAAAAIRTFLDAINPMKWGEKLTNKVNEWKAKITGEEVISVNARSGNYSGTRTSGGSSSDGARGSGGVTGQGDSARHGRERSTGGSSQSLSRGVGTRYADLDLKKFASGGVVYGDSIIRVGEYAGASTNLEVIAPQGIIQETMEKSNMGVIDALYVMSSRICKAIETNRAVVNVGGKQLADDITRQQNDRSKMTGKPILAV